MSAAIAKSGLEVYETTDSNVESVSENSEKEGYVLHNGDITEIAYFDEMISNSFEQDYEDISSNGSVTLLTVNQKRFYKGKKVLLKKAYSPKKWDDLDNCLMGFITEQSYSEDDVEIKISGMDILLEQEKEFSFTNRKISEILTEMIESAGLKADIDVDGLKDEVISYSNKSDTTSSSSNNSMSSTGSSTIDEAVQNAIQGKTTDLEKAKAIDSAFKNHIIYKLYSDVHHPDLNDAWNNWLNCADGANVLCAMFISAGLNAVIVHVPPELTQGYGHYIVKLTINGKTYYTDNAANTGSHTSRPFGEVWLGQTS